MIFLLNLEVGYLHPPVGLNLFITSVKFQRPITEVMWATVPFLLTMIAALLVITYVPQITAVSVPEPERTGRITDLAGLVHSAVEEKRAVKEVTLVAADGTVLTDAAGAPIVVKTEECGKLEPEKQGSCQNLFFYGNECKTDAKPDECTHKKIAGWTRRNRSLTVVREIPLVDDDKKPVHDKAGAPIVLTFPACEAETDSDKKGACHELFDTVSACKIDPEDKSVASCTFDAVSKWVGENKDSL